MVPLYAARIIEGISGRAIWSGSIAGRPPGSPARKGGAFSCGKKGPSARPSDEPPSSGEATTIKDGILTIFQQESAIFAKLLRYRECDTRGKSR